MLTSPYQWLRSIRKVRCPRTPTLLQMDGVECGAASLGIILRHYGCWIPLLELRHQVGVTRDGSSAASLLRVARSYGLDGKGLLAPIQLLKTLSPPYIVFWKLNHFLVIEGIEKTVVYVNDPATGRRRVSIADFNRFYTGVVLTLKPGPNFQKINRMKGVVPALISRLKFSKTAILMALVAGLGLTLVRLAIPAFSQVFIDEILIEGRQDWLRPLLVVMIIAAILQSSIAQIEFYALRQLMIKLLVVTKSHFFAKVLRLPAFYYDQRFAGDLSSRIELNDDVVRILRRLSKTVIDVLMLGCYAVLMALYDRTLTLVTIGLAFLNLLALKILRKFRVETSLQLSQEKGRLSGATVASIQAIETIKASGLESYAFSLFSGLYAQVLNIQRQLSLQSQVLAIVPILLRSLTIAFVLIFGGYRVLEGNLSIGMLIAYQMMVASFLRPINHLVSFGSALQTLQANLERLDDVLQSPDDPVISHDPSVTEQPPILWHGTVQLDQITFDYSRSEDPLIQGFNLHIAPGQRVALVGKTGSGKSTIAKLVCGIYAPWQGEIRFDNIPRPEIARALLSSFVATVSQEVFLFAGTIRDNLTLWNPTIPHAHLVQACQDAEIHELILSLPEGYETQLSEGGRNLSGGERQRLEIARALVQNPAVLVLDEATSALDAELEWRIGRNLKHRGCTCIVVAHRLSTIRDCDQILVIRNGQIQEQGTHQDLWSQGGYYARLISDQHQMLSPNPQTCDQLSVHVQQTRSFNLAPGFEPPEKVEKNGGQHKAVPPSPLALQIEDSRYLKANESLRLEDLQGIWEIASGAVELYSMASVNGVSCEQCRLLLSLNTGESIIGSQVRQIRSFEPAQCLIIMAVEPVLLHRLDQKYAIYRASEQTSSLSWGHWFERLEQWMLAQVSVPAQKTRLMQTGLHLCERHQYVQSCLDRLAWARVRSGRIVWLGSSSAVIEPYCPFFPISPGSWFCAEVNSEIEVFFFERLKQRTFSLEASADFFQQLFINFLNNLERQQQQAAVARTQELQKFQEQLLHASLGELAQIVRPMQQRQKSREDALFATAQAIGNVLDIDIRLPPHWENLPPTQRSIEAIARSSNVPLRRVKLSENWWSQEQGPLLGFVQVQKHPVALFPRGKRYWALDARTGIQIPVDPTLASQLASEAYQFYRPLPRIGKTWEILRFSIAGLGRELFLLLGLGIIATLLGMIMPHAVSLLVDTIIPNSDRILLAQMAGIILVIAFATAALQLSRGILALRVEQKMTGTLQTAVWDRLLHLPSSFFRQYASGDLLIRILAIGQIRSLLTGATRRSLLGGFFALINIGLMWALSPQLSLIAMIFVGISAGMTMGLGAVLIRKERQQEQLNGELYGLTVQLIQGVQKLRIAAAESRAFALWAQKFAQPVQLTADIQRLNDKVAVVSEMLALSSSVLIFLAVASQLQGASSISVAAPISMGTFVAFNAAYALFAGGITALSNTLTDILGIVPLWERAQPILRGTPETQSHQVCLEDLQGHVTVEDVSFQYREGPLTINHVSLQANPGEYIAIVGASGSGKSTLVRLLLGLEMPLNGTVYYDSCPLTEFDLQSLRQQLGVVLQQDQLIRASIYDNITCGGKVTLAQAWEAAEMAAIADDIAQLPMGMHTLVSEGGRNLSGGQRQRLLIARALISKPKVIVFDEATSALDNRSQRMISEAINQMHATRIVIAHRLSTVRNADRIYVMDAGQIAEVGTFETLMMQSNRFSKLVSRQML